MTFSETQLSSFSFLKCLYLQDVPSFCHVVWISLNITTIHMKGNGKYFLRDIPHNVMILHVWNNTWQLWNDCYLWSCFSSCQMLIVMLRYWWSLKTSSDLKKNSISYFCSTVELVCYCLFPQCIFSSEACNPNVSWWPPI